MKIILSAYACNPKRGSEYTVGWNWAKSLSRYNEVLVLTREYNKKDIQQEVYNSKIENIDFLYYDLPKKYDWFFSKNRYTSYLYYIAWQFSLYRILARDKKYKKYDLIQHITYNSFKNPGFLWKLNCNFVMGPVGGGQVIPKGFKDCYKGYILNEWTRKLINRLMAKSMYLKRAYNGSKAIIVANDDTFDIVNTIKFNKNIEVIKMLETGIQKSKVNKLNRMLYNNDKVILMWAGNSQYIKGLILLLKALAKIENRKKVIIKLVGNIDVKKYSKIVKQYGIEEIVQFTGVVNYTEMDKLYKLSDIFIFTSLRDTSGNVVLEAMANSLPIITLNHQGVKDIVDNSCGIKIEPQNTRFVVEKLANAIDRLVDSKELRCEMGENSYNRIKDNYLWEKKAEEMTALYNRILKDDCYESFND